MIYWFTGQPGSGKTTLARLLKTSLEQNIYIIPNCYLIDGDNIRDILNNKDYSEFGRRKNIEAATIIAKYIASLGCNVVVSLVSPFRDMREALKKEHCVTEIYVHTTDVRGREDFHVKDYEPPLENFIEIDTTNKNPQISLQELLTKLLENGHKQITNQK